MYISRSLSKKLAFSLIGAFLLFAFYVIKKQDDNYKEKHVSGKTEQPSKQENKNSEHISKKPDDEQNNNIVINNFERSEVKDGKKIWEIKAAKGSLAPGSSDASIEEATMNFYKEDGSIVKVQSPKAKLSIENGSVSKALLSGGVIVNFSEQYTVKTETADFSQTTQEITSQTQATITNNDFEIVGGKLQANAKTKLLVLTDGVKTTIFAKKKLVS